MTGNLQCKPLSSSMTCGAPVNFVHIQDAPDAQTVWQKLSVAFADTGVPRKGGLLKTLVTTYLEKCSSVEEYVNWFVTTAPKLKGGGFTVREEWVGWLLLAGLPERYEPMIMGIESSGTAITDESIKTKLLQDVKVDTVAAEGQTLHSTREDIRLDGRLALGVTDVTK